MEIQSLFVAIVIFIAILYVGKMMVAKVRSFSAKANCGNDCGCNSESKTKLTQIHKNQFRSNKH